MRLRRFIIATLAVIPAHTSPISERARLAGAAVEGTFATSTVVFVNEDVVYVTASAVYVTVTEWMTAEKVTNNDLASVRSTDDLKITMASGLPMHMPPFPMRPEQPPMSTTQLSCASSPQPITAPSEVAGESILFKTLSSPVPSFLSQTLTSTLMSSVIIMSDIEASATSQPLPTSTIVQSLRPFDPVFTKLAVYSHNVHRANHSDTNPLVYNHTLAHYAKEKVSTCIWSESLPADAINVGMNMAEGTYIGPANVTGIIEDMWYNSEIALFPAYNESSPSMNDFQDWGHFTQVIWRATTSVGCWSSACDRNDGAQGQIGSGFFTVCMYFPAGNVGGEYADQVGTPLGQRPIHGD